ncbi:MAG: hypothetical protein H6897_06070 [Rhodobacteraceae bacterium]|jgi:hypothetical protein|uniref:hypothetical protein n=1 Tax=Albidovulum sp. TaxID=1872424 RepID=UPI001DFDA34A|nr:hypothetical protein [uncultured Defluviimonas sp.]MCB2127197.1 hypothetical protein [Paracoccaceae bacterium]MCC0069479.1 hypothetical protein [Paracoccaceae bacterium]
MNDFPKGPRPVTPRGWVSLTLAGTAIGLAVAGPAAADTPLDGPERLWLAQGTEAGEGGEAGEAGTEASGDEVVDLLKDLGLIEGHLRAGVALYRAGLADQAAHHMKHPQDEIYDELSFHLADFGAEGFAEELTALATAVESGQPVEAVDAALAEVLKAIAGARGHANASDAEGARAMVAILRQAADEYGDGVKDGGVTELQEYQDAWGFLEAVRDQAAHMAGEEDAAKKTFGEKTLAALDTAREALPDVSPEGRTLGDASALHAAVATVELAAYQLR